MRARVYNTRYHLLFEYCCAYLAEYNFDQVMTKFLKARKFMRDSLGVELDLKKDNPNFGKKNTFKKS